MSSCSDILKNMVISREKMCSVCCSIMLRNSIVVLPLIFNLLC
jgi:hypothetical protein